MAQLQLTKYEFSVIEEELKTANLSFKYCEKHSRYERNLKDEERFNAERQRIDSMLFWAKKRLQPVWVNVDALFDFWREGILSLKTKEETKEGQCTFAKLIVREWFFKDVLIARTENWSDWGTPLRTQLKADLAKLFKDNNIDKKFATFEFA